MRSRTCSMPPAYVFRRFTREYYINGRRARRSTCWRRRRSSRYARRSRARSDPRRIRPGDYLPNGSARRSPRAWPRAKQMRMRDGFRSGGQKAPAREYGVVREDCRRPQCQAMTLSFPRSPAGRPKDEVAANHARRCAPNARRSRGGCRRRRSADTGPLGRTASRAGVRAPKIRRDDVDGPAPLMKSAADN